MSNKLSSQPAVDARAPIAVTELTIVGLAGANILYSTSIIDQRMDARLYGLTDCGKREAINAVFRNERRQVNCPDIGRSTQEKESERERERVEWNAHAYTGG